MALFNKEPEKNPKIQPTTTPSSFIHFACARSIDFPDDGRARSAIQRTSSGRRPRVS